MSHATEIAVLSTISTKEALIELVPLFQRESGFDVVTTFGGGPALADKVRGGLAGDLFIGPDEFNEPLLDEGKLVQDSRVPFALSTTAVAIRAGAAKPDIGTVEGLKQALLAAKTVSYSRGASGMQFVKALDDLGIADAIAAKLVRPQPGELVGAVVARGEADYGIQQLSELLPVSGIEILGPLPGSIQNRIVYATSLMATSRQPEAAQAFAQFMRSETARRILETKGFDPI